MISTTTVQATARQAFSGGRKLTRGPITKDIKPGDKWDCCGNTQNVPSAPKRRWEDGHPLRLPPPGELHDCGTVHPVVL